MRKDFGPSIRYVFKISFHVLRIVVVKWSRMKSRIILFLLPFLLFQKRIEWFFFFPWPSLYNLLLHWLQILHMSDTDARVFEQRLAQRARPFGRSSTAPSIDSTAAVHGSVESSANSSPVQSRPSSRSLPSLPDDGLTWVYSFVHGVKPFISMFLYFISCKSSLYSSPNNFFCRCSTFLRRKLASYWNFSWRLFALSYLEFSSAGRRCPIVPITGKLN